VFCVLEPREIYRDTGPIAAVVAECADPRAMARFWSEAMDWTLHKVTDDYAALRSAKGAGPYLEFLRTPSVRTWWNRIHLDVMPYAGDDQEAEVTRLRALAHRATLSHVQRRPEPDWGSRGRRFKSGRPDW
jgi:hypothetical protein